LHYRVTRTSFFWLLALKNVQHPTFSIHPTNGREALGRPLHCVPLLSYAPPHFPLVVCLKQRAPRSGTHSATVQFLFCILFLRKHVKGDIIFLSLVTEYNIVSTIYCNLIKKEKMMNKIIAGIAILVVATTATYAQYCGTPLADNLTPKESGTYGIDFISMNQKDSTGSTAARFRYSLFSGFKIFGDIGLIGFDDLALQGGLLYTLPTGSALKLGARGTVGQSFGDADAASYSLSFATGYTIPSIAWLSIYAQFGYSHFDAKHADAEGGFLGTFGAMFNYDEDVAFFVEVGTNDALPSDNRPYISMGLGFDF